MYAYPWIKPLMAIVLVGLAGCGSENEAPSPMPQTQTYQQGWSHNCKLSCTNVSVNQTETVERPGRNGSGTVCNESRQACENERAAACANAIAMANNETLYDNCQLVDEGVCVEGCTLLQ